MKALSLILILGLTGCAFHRTTEITYEQGLPTDKTTFVGISFFNRTAVEGLTVGQRTDKETSVLSLKKGSTETQTEAIKAAGEALGAGIATGVRKSIVP